MNPVETDPAPVSRPRLLAARVLLWVSLVLLVAAQFRGWWDARPLWSEWVPLTNVIVRMATGAPVANFPWGRIASFLAVHFFPLFMPWFPRALIGHALLRWTARVSAAAVWIVVVWCVIDFWSHLPANGPIPAGAWGLMLSACLTTLGLFLLPGRKTNAAPFIPSGHDPETPATTTSRSDA